MNDKTIEDKVLATFNQSHPQHGYFHPSEKVILKYKYFNTETKNIQIILAILSTIAYYEIDKTVDKKEIAKKYLNHEDIEVRDSAIGVFETIPDKESIEILENSERDPIDWIEKYKQQVIKDLKGGLFC